MERDFLRYQQLVMTKDIPRRASWKTWLAPVACVAVALAVLSMVRSGSDEARAGDELVEGRSPFSSIVSGGEGRMSLENLDDRSKEAMDELLSGNAAATGTMGTFLDVLADEDSAHGENGVRLVAWEEQLTLPDAAERVLRAYQGLGSASLMAAGYLDIKGNAWAALVRLEDGSADVMTVMTADDVVSKVRVARICPEGDAG